MSLWRAAARAAAISAVAVGTAAAQPTQPTGPAPAPGAPAAGEPPTIAKPEVADPMLAPPEAAPAEIHTWDEAIAMMRRAPSYLTSVEGVERALAQRTIARASVMPTLNAQASYLHNFETLSVPFGTTTLVTPPPTIWSVGAAANWQVINPRGLYSLGTADVEIDVAKLSLADRRRLLAESVVAAMLGTLAAERAAELNRVGLQAALERLVLTQTRLKFSRGTELDADRARQDVAAARALVVSGDESLRQAREALGQALGSATPLSAPVGLDVDGFEQAVAATCHLGSTIEQRADIVAAKRRVTLADRQITDAKLLLAPTLGVGAQAAAATQSTLGPLDTWSIGVTLNVPIYDGGARYGQLRDARAAAQQARQALAQARVDALIEAGRAARAIGVDTAARDVAKEQRDLAARVDTRVREGYASGLGTSLDLVTSAQALRQAELSLVLLDFQLAQARASAVLVDAECVF